MVAPDFVEQLGAAVDALGVLHQVVQQLEFGRADFERLALPRDAVRGRVQRQRGDGDAVGHLLGRAPAQHGADARQQLLGGKRFGDVVVGTSVQAGDLVRLVAARGQHQDGHGFGAGILAPFARQLQAALAGQHPVEQDDIGQHGIQLALRGIAVFGPNRRKAVVAQVDGNQLGNRRLVFDDEDAGQVFHHSTLDSIWSSEVWRTSLPSTK